MTPDKEKNAQGMNSNVQPQNTGTEPPSSLFRSLPSKGIKRTRSQAEGLDVGSKEAVLDDASASLVES